MNVSIWTMVLWLLSCLWTIKNLFNKQKPIKLDKEFNEDEKILAWVMIVGFSFLMIGINIWYLVASASVINNIYFTLVSAGLILATLFSIKKIFKMFNKFLKQEEVESNNRLSVMGLVKILQLVYFGYYVFTGVSLIDLFIK